MVNPLSTTPAAGSSVETSGRTCILMVLCPVIRGVNVRRMPNSRNMTVTAPTPAPPCTTGTGNSPPTRKLASLPSVATRFGSARICSTPCVLSAWMNAPTFRSGRKANTFSASLIEKFEKYPELPPGMIPLSPFLSS